MLQSIRKQRIFKDYLFIITMLAPILLGYLFIRFIPIGETLVYSFYTKSLIGKAKGFVGFANFGTILKDEFFRESFRNTIFFTFTTSFLSTVTGLLIALALNSKSFRLKSLYQSLFFIPVIVSLVPATLVWKVLFDYNYGFINYILSFLRIKPVEWLINSNICIYPIIILSIWKEIGYDMIIFLVGLKAIPKTYYESASIDGAGSWHSFWHITMPLLKPITLFILVISIIRNVRVFTQAYVMSIAFQASGEVVRTIVYYIYQMAFEFFDMGKASAAATLLLIIVLVFTWLQFKVAKE